VTRERILDAALETLKADGFAGATARGIARTGGFNQALVFYHFGSVDEVLLRAVDRMGERRLATYRERLAEAGDLSALLAVARDVLGEDVQHGAMTILSQLVAAAHGRPDFGRRLAASFDPWIDLVDQAVQRVLADTGLEGVLRSRDVALALTAPSSAWSCWASSTPDRDTPIRSWPASTPPPDSSRASSAFWAPARPAALVPHRRSTRRRAPRLGFHRGSRSLAPPTNAAPAGAGGQL